MNPASPHPDQSDAERSPGNYSLFAFLNALVDGGWLRELSGVEMAVLTCYMRHAGADGLAYPGPKRIATAVGHAQARHVRDARRSLVDRGLLSVVSVGGGREPMKLRVNVPHPAPNRAYPRIGPTPKTDLPPKRAGHPGPNPAYHPSPNPAYHLGPNRGTEQHIEQPIEGPKEQPSSPEPTRASPSGAVASPPASDPAMVAYPVFPCIPGRRSRDATWALTDQQIAEWAETFPAVDVPAECRKAHGWIKAKPQRRKTAGGMGAFLWGWLSRCQNAGGRSSAGKATAHERGEFAEHSRPFPMFGGSPDDEAEQARAILRARKEAQARAAGGVVAGGRP